MNQKRKEYDLEERTAVFGEQVIDLCKKMPKSTITQPLISQILRSATSVGANYMEANAASSRKDFRHKIYISKKEIQETKFWLRMLARALPKQKSELKKLWEEAHDLTLIFQQITNSLKIKN